MGGGVGLGGGADGVVPLPAVASVILLMESRQLVSQGGGGLGGASPQGQILHHQIGLALGLAAEIGGGDARPLGVSQGQQPLEFGLEHLDLGRVGEFHKQLTAAVGEPQGLIDTAATDIATTLQPKLRVNLSLDVLFDLTPEWVHEGAPCQRDRGRLNTNAPPKWGVMRSGGVSDYQLKPSLAAKAKLFSSV